MTPFNASDSRNAWVRAHNLGSRLNATTPLRKASVIAGGYFLGAVAASLAVLCHLALCGGPSSPNYGGAQAFGDFLLFGGAFAMATIPSACGGFYFLRSTARFWKIFAWSAAIFGMTGVAALAIILTASLSLAGGVAFLRILLAPVAALGFLLGAVFSPGKRERKMLSAACAMEAVAFSGWFVFALIHAEMGA
jgi:hypothetical protein